ncbi:MAG: 50S ribosomal protein L3 [Enterobacterales bacterium]
MNGLIGRKLGMTRIFNKDGISIPITVIEILENRVTQIKTLKKDGYNSIQVTTGIKKSNRINKPEVGHFLKSNVKPGRILLEFRVSKNHNIILGQSICIDIFTNVKKIDVTGISKGKGFAGVIKRWNFKSQDASHGNSLSHRAPGSIGQNQTPGRVFKGKKMAGQLGNKKTTILNLNIIRIDKIRNLLLVKGSIPGSNGSDVVVKPAIKCNIRRK